MNNKKSLELIHQLQIVIKEFKDEENNNRLDSLRDKVDDLETEICQLEKKENSTQIQSREINIEDTGYNCFRYVSNLIQKIRLLLLNSK